MVKNLCLLLVLSMCIGCVSTNVGSNVNGLMDNDGDTFAHQETSIWALHWVFGAGDPIVEDASFENAVNEFTAAAKADGRTASRISGSATSNYWWIFPPFSFIITPINARVAGDVK